MASPSDPFRVLFVCTGNTCRSPLAEAALRLALRDEGERVQIISAGTAAAEGDPATRGSMDVAAADGLDLHEHRARRLTEHLARDADLVLVMERAHVVSVVNMGADPSRVHVLSEWPVPGAPELPVSDPFGGSREAYEECWRRIRHHVERAAPQVRGALRARSA